MRESCPERSKPVSARPPCIQTADQHKLTDAHCQAISYVLSDGTAARRVQFYFTSGTDQRPGAERQAARSSPPQLAWATSLVGTQAVTKHHGASINLTKFDNCHTIL